MVRNPLEKLLFFYLLEKFRTLYWTQKFVPLFTSDHLWSVSSARWIQFTRIQFPQINFNIILNPCVALRCVSYLQVLPQKLFFFQPCLMPQQFLFSLLDHCNNIWPWVHTLKLVVRPFYFQSLSNFNYNTVKAFHILHLTFLKPYGHMLYFFTQQPLSISALF